MPSYLSSYLSFFQGVNEEGILRRRIEAVITGQTRNLLALFIGLVGSNGNSTGPHLHLEIHDPSLGDGGDVSDLLTPDDFLSEHGAVDISEMCD